MPNLRDLFLLDPNVIFLNHGSFGATPRPVFEAYQAWQRRLERQPVLFLGRELLDLLAEARAALAEYVGTAADNLVYLPNATFGVNIVARSLALGPGDEVLTSDHEYGACDRTWRFLSKKHGFTYRKQPIPLPPGSAEDVVERLWQGVSPRTRLIFLSHITSPTAVRFPVEAVCARARQAGIMTIVDGAHTPGQILLNLEAIGADFYAGNCHKWLMAPKGSGFLYARPECQGLVEPLVVSWGWGEEGAFATGSDFLDHVQWMGTSDPAAYLAVPAAIPFQAEHDWPAVRERCRALLSQALHRISELTGLEPLYSSDGASFCQMAVAPLPKVDDLVAFKNRLYDEHRIEIPCVEWNGWQLIRLSVQGYNSQADIDGLLVALEALLRE